ATTTMSQHCCGHCGNCGNRGTRNMLALPYVNGEEDMYYPSEECVPYMNPGAMIPFMRSATSVSIEQTSTYYIDERGRMIPMTTRKVTVSK
ncbi:hypothetical protein NFI96_015046, partial [Prochilodus magdalenae]